MSCEARCTASNATLSSFSYLPEAMVYCLLVERVEDAVGVMCAEKRRKRGRRLGNKLAARTKNDSDRRVMVNDGRFQPTMSAPMAC